MENKKRDNDYHKYVIDNGQFIGDFENMYKNCHDPWMQSQQPNKYSRTAGILYIEQFKITSLLECGCGLGYYANWVHKETGVTPISVDLSHTCIQKAKNIFPHLKFEQADISKNLHLYQGVDCVLFSEIIWYILADLETIIDDLKKYFKNKYFLVNQVFYKGSQKYGREFFTNLREFIDAIPFELLGYCEATTVNDSTIETSSIYRI